MSSIANSNINVGGGDVHSISLQPEFSQLIIRVNKQISMVIFFKAKAKKKAI